MEDMQPVRIPGWTQTVASHFCVCMKLLLRGNRCWSEDRAPHLVRSWVGGLPHCLWSQTFLGRILTNSAKQEKGDHTYNVLSSLLFKSEIYLALFLGLAWIGLFFTRRWERAHRIDNWTRQGDSPYNTADQLTAQAHRLGGRFWVVSSCIVRCSIHILFH